MRLEVKRSSSGRGQLATGRESESAITDFANSLTFTKPTAGAYSSSCTCPEATTFSNPSLAMPLDSSIVEHIARLARIDIDVLSAAERQRLVDDMNRLVGFVDLLGEVDVTDVLPQSHPTETTLRLRADEAVDPPGAAKVLANAPEASNDSFLVPQVVSGGGDDA